MAMAVVDARTHCETFVELLAARTQQQPDQTGYTFLTDGMATEASLTYAELERQAQRIAATLQELVSPGDRALLLYPPGLDYLAAFFGCLYAGVVAVPAYPPDPIALPRTLPRLRAIAQDAQAGLILTISPIQLIAQSLVSEDRVLSSLPWLATDTLADHLADTWHLPIIARDTLAMLQYTSGSTATPRGVMLSHGNLLHNSAHIYHCFGHTPESRGVIWLPPYHDMGLIGGILQPLYGNFPVVLLSPLDFLRKPLCWLQAITRYRATTSGGPNFAYDLCVRKISPQQRANLDLRSWQVAFNGAEPIRSESLAQFAAAFAPYGFNHRAFYPCYGLAEATLLVTGGLVDTPATLLNVAPQPLQQNQVVTTNSRTQRPLIGCGQPLPDQELVIVEPTTQQLCSPGQIGEIWVAGAGIAQGYWNRPEETTASFRAALVNDKTRHFLRTGDLGFVHDGELFVTGRLKDLLIIRGRNYYPHDIEQTVEQSHSAIRPGCSAVFAIEEAGTEQLVVVCEVDFNRCSAQDKAALPAVIREAITLEHGLAIYTVFLLEPRSIPKTSSGKLQRHACRAAYLNGTLKAVTISVMQATRPIAHQHDGHESSAQVHKLLMATLHALPLSARSALLTEHLQYKVAALLARATPPDSNVPLAELGLDEMRAVALQQHLQTTFNQTVSLATLLAASSLTAVADLLAAGADAVLASHSDLEPVTG